MADSPRGYQVNNGTIIGSFRLGPLGFSPMDLSKYLQFTSPLFDPGLVRSIRISPIQKNRTMRKSMFQVQ
jgi:hypothetical protein